MSGPCFAREGLMRHQTRAMVIRSLLVTAAVLPTPGLRAAIAGLLVPRHETHAASPLRGRGKSARLRRFGVHTALVRRRLSDYEVLCAERRRAGTTGGAGGA